MPENSDRSDRKQPEKSESSDPAVLLATWFGSGLLPRAPGTWGSLAALPPAWFIHLSAGWAGLLAGVVIVFVIGIWAANGYMERFGGDDPSPVVIDEVAGQWLTLAAAAWLTPYGPDLAHYGVAFVMFRLADIFKPWPVSWADRAIKGGLGVMLDDILAGLYAALAVFLIMGILSTS